MIVLLMLACSPDEIAKPAASTVDPVDTGSVVTAPSVPEVSESEIGEGSVEPVETVSARRLKRMSVAQARDSMVQISGGVYWGDDDDKALVEKYFTKPPVDGAGDAAPAEPWPFWRFSAGLRIWKEHISVSSTDIIAPALSNSPQ